MSAPPLSSRAPQARANITAGSGVFAVRLAAAMIQAGALYALASTISHGETADAWPATMPSLLLPFGLISMGIPLLVMLGAGRLPAGALALWALVATLLLAALGSYDIARQAPGVLDAQEGVLPWWPLLPLLLIGFFVANVLVTDAVLARRWLPPYARHIDTAWKQGLQAVFAGLFAGLFWGVLGLGAGLFHVLNIDLFASLLQQGWFYIPATTLAVAVAVHLTDVQPVLIRGGRTVALLLLSWLLPLLTTILLAFLALLPFTSLDLLWQTHIATVLLLGSSGGLIFLINTAYGDGEAWSTSRIKRLTVFGGSLALVPLVGLAAWALMLRVGQYGWTVNRILAAAGMAVLGWHAVGYAAASLARRVRWHEVTNFTGAYLVLLAILLLLSPVGDPARLMVANQMNRLRSGIVAPTAFDFMALRDDGARWGATALDELKADHSTAIANAAQKAGQPAATHPDPEDKQVLTPEQLAERLTVMPAGRTLPKSLLHAEFGPGNGYPPSCFLAGFAICTVRFVALIENEPEIALLLDGSSAIVFTQTAPDHWQRSGTLSGPVGCPDVQSRLKDGAFTLVPHPARDVSINGVTLTLTRATQGCP